MLTTWLISLAAKSRRRRALRRIGKAILDHIDRAGSLVLNKEGLALLATTRRGAFQAVYELVLSEQAHMRATRRGQVIVMSNTEFTRFMCQRAEITNQRLRTRSATVEPPTDIEAEPIPLVEVEYVSPLPATPIETTGEYDWFMLDVSPDDVEDGENRLQLPPLRQSLPDRKREAWVAEGIDLSNTKNNRTKK